MRVDGFKCDECTNVCNRNEMKGWFVVYRYTEDSKCDEFNFCSPGCLRAWAIKQWREDSPVDTGGPVIALSGEEYERRFGKSRRVEKPLSSQSMQINNMVPGE